MSIIPSPNDTSLSAVPRTERQYWAAIADALNAAENAGMSVGIDLDATLTDHRTWSVVWNRDDERWEVAGYDEDVDLDASREPVAAPLVVSRFDAAIEPAPEEEQILTVGCIAEDGRPVALLLNAEDRAKVAEWLAPHARERVTSLERSAALAEEDCRRVVRVASQVEKSLRARVAELEARAEKTAAFCAQRAEYVTSILNCHPDNAHDYYRWQGHAESRRQLSEQLGLPVAWSAETEPTPASVEDPHDSSLHHSYALSRDLPEVSS